jgi:hypothetical protein
MKRHRIEQEFGDFVPAFVSAFINLRAVFYKEINRAKFSLSG